MKPVLILHQSRISVPAVELFNETTGDWVFVVPCDSILGKWRVHSSTGNKASTVETVNTPKLLEICAQWLEGQ